MLRPCNKQLKKQCFQQKLKIAELLLDRGIGFTQKEKYDYALQQYETCLSVFSDVRIQKRLEDISEDDLSLAKFSHNEAKFIQNLRLRLYEQMAKGYFVLRDQNSCIKMCDQWLSLNPQCLEALLLRAKSRLLTNNPSTWDYEMAYKDLCFALQIDPTNQAVVKFQEKFLTKFKQQEYRRQDEDEELQQQEFMAHLASQDYGQELSYEQDTTKPIPIEVIELGKFIETRGLQMVKIYQQNGQIREAEDLREKLQKAIAAKKQLEKISQLDFNRPKKKLYDIAQKYGIDLLDSSVQNQFKRIQEQNLEDIREWLKQNQWDYQDKFIQMQQQEQARQELAKLQFKGKTVPQKNKFNKKLPQHHTGAPITIHNNITYNQTFNSCNNVINNNLNQNETDVEKANIQENGNHNEEEQQENCNCFINLIILIAIIVGIVSPIYVTFLR